VHVLRKLLICIAEADMAHVIAARCHWPLTSDHLADVTLFLAVLEMDDMKLQPNTRSTETGRPWSSREQRSNMLSVKCIVMHEIDSTYGAKPLRGPWKYLRTKWS
jgi:hypothetical protein